MVEKPSQTRSEPDFGPILVLYTTVRPLQHQHEGVNSSKKYSRLFILIIKRVFVLPLKEPSKLVL